MSHLLTREQLALLLLETLDEEGYKRTVHMLETESGLFFNLHHFESLLLRNAWDEAVDYLSGFTQPTDNSHSFRMYFKIWHQRYSDDTGRTEGIDSREKMIATVKSLIHLNPLFHTKLQYPCLGKSRLRTLIKQSLTCPRNLGSNPKQVPDMSTLFHDHSCGPVAFRASPANEPLNRFPPEAASMLKRVAPTSNPGIDSQTGAAEHVLKKVRASGIFDHNLDASRELKNSKPSHFRSLRLPDTHLPSRIVGLTFANCGRILALDHTGVHKLWRWKNENNEFGKATTKVSPEVWEPQSRLVLSNHILDTHCQDSIGCFAVSKEEYYLVSSSGGDISIYSMVTYEKRNILKLSVSAAACLTFRAQDDFFIALGMKDTTIQIYKHKTCKVTSKMNGHLMITNHRDRVTGLAFSSVLNVLVSSSANYEMMVWELNGWKMQNFRTFKGAASIRLYKPHAETRVMFLQDQIHLLYFHYSVIAMFEVPSLQFLTQWAPDASMGHITDVVYACDFESIYATFDNGNVRIFTSSLEVRCQIYPASYLPLSPSVFVYPTKVAAHPSEPDQFAIGLSDGGVVVLEPLESTEQCERPSTSLSS